MRVRVRGAFVLLCLSLTGCSGWSDFWSVRYGPGGVVDPNRVTVTVGRQEAVLSALAVNGGIYRADSYYEVMLAGFNYSDEICSFYLDNLHQFERRKTRIKDTLNLTLTAATAVMSAAEVTKDTVVYVTEALGFSSGLVGIVADSYLYRLSPGILSGIVKTLHDAYLKDLAARRKEVNSPQMTYYFIREYYSLCLPVTIEAKIEEYLAAAKGTQDTKDTKKDEPGAKGAAGVTLTPWGVPVGGPH